MATENIFQYLFFCLDVGWICCIFSVSLDLVANGVCSYVAGVVFSLWILRIRKVFSSQKKIKIHTLFLVGVGGNSNNGKRKKR